MAALEIESRWVKLTHGDLQIDAYLAQPQGEGTHPGVVVFQEVFGVNAHIRDVSDRLAREGYVAIAPALYQRSEPGFEVGYSDAELAKGREYKQQTDADELLGDTKAAIAYLQSLPNTSDRTGSIGFCFGGHVAYLSATLPELQAVASFYGAGIATLCPGKANETTLDRTASMSGTLYCFFGNEDPLIPNDQVDRIEATLKAHQIDHRIFRYDGAGHGFFCDRRDSYKPEIAADAWQQTLELFDRVLRP